MYGAPPIQPRPFRIAFGVAMCLVSGWLLLGWIPSKKPMDEAETAAYVLREASRGNLGIASEWRLKPKAYVWANILAAGLGIWGLSGVIRGATYRPKARR